MSFEDLKVKRIEGELGAELLKLYGINKRFVKIGEKEWYLPYKFAEHGDKLYNFETRPDDTWIVTYPRSGTTVTQELIWLVANDMNFEEAHQSSLHNRFPYIDLSLVTDHHTVTDDEEQAASDINHRIKYVRDQPSPRFIKSHLPLELLPNVENSDCKIIYVARNPKDLAVSWYNFQKKNKLLQYLGTFEKFCDMFMADHTMYSPYWAHIKEGWAKRHRPNTLFLFYEDLVKDLSEVIKKVATFFVKTYSEEQIAKLAEHLNVDNFRKNPMITSLANIIKPEDFIREGKSGGWKDVLTPEINDKFNKWIAENLKDTDLIFPS